MTPIQRQALHLFRRKEFDTVAISKALGISEAEADQLLRDARAAEKKGIKKAS